MRTVRDIMENISEEKDPADVAAGMIEKPEALLRVLRANMEQVEKQIATAQSRLAGSRKAGAGATQAVDLVREYLVTPLKHLKETADLAYGAVMKVAK